MQTFRVTLDIRAENKSDARELLEDYTGKETDITIALIEEVEE